MPMSFNICAPTILRFLSSLVIRWNGFLWGLKKILKTKSWWIQKEMVVLEEDIKHLIHYALTIDATYAQVANGKEDTQP